MEQNSEREGKLIQYSYPRYFSLIIDLYILLLWTTAHFDCFTLLKIHFYSSSWFNEAYMENWILSGYTKTWINLQRQTSGRFSSLSHSTHQTIWTNFNRGLMSGIFFHRIMCKLKANVLCWRNKQRKLKKYSIAFLGFFVLFFFFFFW